MFLYQTPQALVSNPTQLSAVTETGKKLFICLSVRSLAQLILKIIGRLLSNIICDAAHEVRGM